MRTLWNKELIQNWRSFRIPVLFLVLLFFALLDPPITKYMDQIFTLLATDIQLILPDPTGIQALTQFFSDVTQIGYLVVIFISMNSVVAEKESTVASWILTQPVKRSHYLLAKFLVLAAAIFAGVIGASFVAYLYTGTLLEFTPFIPMVIAALSLAVYGLYLFTVTFLGSVLFQTAWMAGGLGLVALFATPLLNIAKGLLSPLQYMPYGLVANIPEIITGTIDWTHLLPTLIVTLAIVLGLIRLAIRRFDWQELG